MAITDVGGSYSVPKFGLLDYYWHRIINDKGCFLPLEFGNHGTGPFDVILQDHAFWRNLSDIRQLPATYGLQRDAMLEHFCPADKLWRQGVLFRVWQVAEAVLKAWV